MKSLRQYTLCILFLMISSYSHSQSNNTLYKGLYFDMQIEEAKKEIKANKENYTDISFGDGVVWRLFKQNFHVVEDRLKGLVLTPQGFGFGMSHENAKIYLINSKAFFISKGYTIFKEPLDWDVPVLFSPQNKTGLVLIDPDEEIVVELRSREFISPGSSTQSYYVTLTINNYDNYMNFVITSEEEKKAEQDKTGF